MPGCPQWLTTAGLGALGVASLQENAGTKQEGTMENFRAGSPKCLAHWTEERLEKWHLPAFSLL